ncbi:GGDEF domain-containing protein [Chitinimonas koreensis]|uniref:GGDEF domain-containing protein n=1 Tax=Chitinimonas koreensis TaxID=356302 RepID=UPI0004198B33|nr:GGDEF domain-containing protein [Chitinimonas koreensis]QNM96030.1 GGDEF domain-containing protein [Chitinimonas koreensis]
MISKPTLTPSDIARITLKRLAELGLSPTPENYVKFYNAIAAIKSPTEKTDQELKSAYQVLFRVSDVLDDMAETSETLLGDLSRGGQAMSDSLDALRGGLDLESLEKVLDGLIESTGSVQQTVSASHQDLQELKASIDKIQSDLSINRKNLEQDPLTGALNRQGLDHLLAKEVKRSRRAVRPLSVALLDLDRFKQVNDRYGHMVGDKVLMHFASLTRAVIRESDTLVRYGGEEFLILLPETDLNGARYLIDRMGKATARTPFFHQGQPIEVRFSAGVAQLKLDETGNALLLRSDEAMYRAKNGGRNQAVFAD